MGIDVIDLTSSIKAALLSRAMWRERSSVGPWSHYDLTPKFTVIECERTYWDTHPAVDWTWPIQINPIQSLGYLSNKFGYFELTICFCLHRFFAHRSLQCYYSLRWCLPGLHVQLTQFFKYLMKCPQHSSHKSVMRNCLWKQETLTCVYFLSLSAIGWVEWG